MVLIRSLHIIRNTFMRVNHWAAVPDFEISLFKNVVCRKKHMRIILLTSSIQLPLYAVKTLQTIKSFALKAGPTQQLLLPWQKTGSETHSRMNPWQGRLGGRGWRLEKLLQSSSEARTAKHDAEGGCEHTTLTVPHFGTRKPIFLLRIHP